ncbi:hypothetical protein D3C87_1515040 [compost metagenome]
MKIQMNRLGKYLCVGVLLICSGILGLFAWDIWEDRSQSVSIIQQTALYDDWEFGDRQKSIGKVERGENLKVLRIRYGKDFMAIKVERNDGSVGWIIWSSNQVSLGS